MMTPENMVCALLLLQISWSAFGIWRRRPRQTKESPIEMLERYQRTNVLLIAKKSMGTPERIYDQERENNV